jgi:hypothetical protein
MLPSHRQWKKKQQTRPLLLLLPLTCVCQLGRWRKQKTWHDAATNDDVDESKPDQLRSTSLSAGSSKQKQRLFSTQKRQAPSVLHEIMNNASKVLVNHARNFSTSHNLSCHV